VLATPWLLFYGTGGAAWGSVETTLLQNCDDGCGAISGKPVTLSSSVSDSRSGWVAGVGVEAMLSEHWSIRGEWLHVDLGTLSNALSSTDKSGEATGVETTTWSQREKFDQFRAGVNYKF
jgi:outer membrane immunogenic protein